MIKALANAALLFTTIASAMAGIVMVTNWLTNKAEPWILPILEESIDEDE